MPAWEKVVLVTRKTRLDGLIERFNTRGQAKFYLEHAGLDFDDYQQEHDVWLRSLEATVRQLERLGLKLQQLDRGLLPTFLFAPTDVVVVLGQDGLVANTAKYAGAQPLVGVNPDASRHDGLLLPFGVGGVRRAVESVLADTARVREVTLAEAVLSDGQRLRAFNELFVGARTHVSAQYRLRLSDAPGPWVRQSSSGVIVSTGAGSTGWLSSVCAMTEAMASALGGEVHRRITMPWEDERLFYVVREPFASRHSSVEEVAGFVEPPAALELESLMPSGGVIFSDGMEADALAFTSGLTARIGPAAQRARLVVA